MNFEQLIKTYVLNYHNILNKKRALSNILNELDLLRIKKEKLKLGKISFEIKYTMFEGIVLHEELEMIHCRQDNTEANERKLENLIDYYSWKWDFNNVGAVLVIFYILYSFVKIYFLDHFNLNLFFYSFSEEDFMQELLRYNFQNMANDSKFFKFPPFTRINFFFYHLLSESVIFFKLV
jgi:hypothetical protein